MRAVQSWVRKIESTKIQEIRRNSIRILKLLVSELLIGFPSGASTEVEKVVKIRVPEFEHADIPRDSEQPPFPTLRRSSDCPVEFQQRLASHRADD
jgi:hypothetical protein